MRRDRIMAAAGAVAATSVAGGIALAAIPSAGGVIHGCYQKNEGQLRVVDPGAQECRASEIPISWNAEGPAGPQGPAGEDGVDGQDGIDGVNGQDGVDGQDGIDGQDGVSVTSAVEPAGGNCATGGSSFTAANGTTYACNGAKGDRGDAGPPGPGTPSVWVKFVGGPDPPIVLASRGLVGLQKLRTGAFRATFDRNVSGCVYSTTPTTGGPIDGALFEQFKGSASAGPSFSAGAPIPNALDIQTANHLGVLADASVSLIVFC